MSANETPNSGYHLSLPAPAPKDRIGFMHVVMLSKACIVGAYQRKLEELAALPDIKLTVLVPPGWRDDRGEQALERVFTRGYELRATPITLNGHFHTHFYPRLRQELQDLQPDLLHIDEEPYNLATRHALGLARRLQIPTCFFTWQNLNRAYPPPFRWWERYAFRHTTCAIAGNHDAKCVLQEKGFSGPVRVIPQFGVDPAIFRPAEGPRPERPFTMGYAGGFISAKGLDTLVHACAHLQGDWRLVLAGSGEQEIALRALADALGIKTQLCWQGKIKSTDMAAFYQTLDAFILPSRSQNNWVEQFGRVLVEAMACAIPVVGSDSGEIPHVIGDAGLIFPEDNVILLAERLQQLIQYPKLRTDLGQKGRDRVLARFTQAKIARETYEVYVDMLTRQQ